MQVEEVKLFAAQVGQQFRPVRTAKEMREMGLEKVRVGRGWRGTKDRGMRGGDGRKREGKREQIEERRSKGEKKVRGRAKVKTRGEEHMFSQKF